jgi:hypothetical protein
MTSAGNDGLLWGVCLLLLAALVALALAFYALRSLRSPPPAEGPEAGGDAA